MVNLTGKYATIFLSLFFLSGCLATNTKRVCFNHVCINSEIADSADTRALGFMFRKKLSEHHGMLFIFPSENVYAFWMKNMEFALDIIWVSGEGKIVDISKDCLPCGKTYCTSIVPVSKAKYVVEVNSGFCQRHNIKIGDQIKFY